jgi:alpha-beta hydrolase superfamily lysophospholipase
MIRSCRPWLRRHRLLMTMVLLPIVGFGVLNIAAYQHAYYMMHFARPGATRTQGIQELSMVGKAWVALTGVQIPRPINRVTPASAGLPYEVHHFPAADGIDLEAWYVSCSQPKGLVILFHGYVMVKSTLLGEAQAFHALGYDCLLVDFRGSGGSAGNETTIGAREANDVEGACNYAQKQWPDRPVVLFGASMGSAAILRALADNDIRPQAAILECPFDRMLTTVEHRFGLMHIPSFPAARLLVYWGGVQTGIDGFAHNPMEYARRVSCPVLIMHGEHDPFVTPAEVRSVYENLAGPKQLEIFSGVGHQSCLAARPSEWKRLVEGFLDRKVGK